MRGQSKIQKQPHRQGSFFTDWGGRRNRAQNALEYAVVIACVAAALIAMQVYFKRGMQGRLRQTADSIGSEYSPKNTIGSTTLTYKSKVQTIVRTIDKDLNNNGIIEDNEKGLTETTSNLIEGENIQNISGSENVGPLEPSLF